MAKFEEPKSLQDTTAFLGRSGQVVVPVTFHAASQVLPGTWYVWSLAPAAGKAPNQWASDKYLADTTVKQGGTTIWVVPFDQEAADFCDQRQLPHYLRVRTGQLTNSKSARQTVG